MLRLVRITESDGDRTDRLIDAIAGIYGDDLNDDEVVRLASNLRKQANEIIDGRERVDMMVNNDEDKAIHDWEDQVTTDRSPVTDRAEIVPAERVSHPDGSADEVDGPGNLERDPDYDGDSDRGDSSGESDGGDAEGSPGETPDDGDAGDGPDDASDGDSDDDGKPKSKATRGSGKSGGGTRNEGFRLVRL